MTMPAQDGADSQEFVAEGSATPPESPADEEQEAKGSHGDGAAEDARVAALVDELEAVRKDLETTRRELEETTQSLRRVHADFANYRRRMMAEQARWEERAVARFITEILPVLDNLERAVAACEQNPEADPEALRQGVALTLRQFQEVLGKNGVEPIHAVGQPFDPRQHEAIMHVETDAVPEQHVVAEIQRGYRFRSEVLRPALVQVAKAPQGSGGQEQSEQAKADTATANADVDGEEGSTDGQSGGH